MYNTIAMWAASLPFIDAERDIVGSNPDRVGVFVVDMVRGFTHEGPLASASVGRLVEPIEGFVNWMTGLGVERMVRIEDAHTPDAEEFRAWPAHCVEKTEETAFALDLPLPWRRFAKNTLSPFASNGAFAAYLGHQRMRHAIVVGNCTDLCVYQTAMGILQHSQANGLGRTVWVASDLTATYHTDAPPFRHASDFFHATFLYHMALNGIMVGRMGRPLQSRLRETLATLAIPPRPPAFAGVGVVGTGTVATTEKGGGG